MTFIPWSLDLLIRVSFQLNGDHTVLQPFLHIELIIHIVISFPPDIDSHLSQVNHVMVKCLAQGHNIQTMSHFSRWEKHDVALKTQAGFETYVAYVYIDFFSILEY